MENGYSTPDAALEVVEGSRAETDRGSGVKFVSATTNWKNDGDLEHERDDNFVDFIHGNVLIQANVNKYRAETVVGITDEGDCVFYDVVDINPYNFQIKKGTSQRVASGNNAFANIQGDSFEGIVPQDPEVVKSAVKKSVEDVEVQPIEESSDGTAMQNYNRLHEDAGLEMRKQKTPEQLSNP